MDHFPFSNINKTQFEDLFSSVDLNNLPTLDNVQNFIYDDKIDKLNDIDLILCENSPNIKCEYYTQRECQKICKDKSKFYSF